jgi:hypothetical protein
MGPSLLALAFRCLLSDEYDWGAPVAESMQRLAPANGLQLLCLQMHPMFMWKNFAQAIHYLCSSKPTVPARSRHTYISLSFVVCAPRSGNIKLARGGWYTTISGQLVCMWM